MGAAGGILRSGPCSSARRLAPAKQGPRLHWAAQDRRVADIRHACTIARRSRRSARPDVRGRPTASGQHSWASARHPRASAVIRARSVGGPLPSGSSSIAPQGAGPAGCRARHAARCCVLAVASDVGAPAGARVQPARFCEVWRVPACHQRSLSPAKILTPPVKVILSTEISAKFWRGATYRTRSAQNKSSPIRPHPGGLDPSGRSRHATLYILYIYIFYKEEEEEEA